MPNTNMPRLKEMYVSQITQQLKEKLGFKNNLQVPRLRRSHKKL